MLLNKIIIPTFYPSIRVIVLALVTIYNDIIEQNNYSYILPLYTGYSIGISAQNGYIKLRLQRYYNPPVNHIM